MEGVRKNGLWSSRPSESGVGDTVAMVDFHTHADGCASYVGVEDVVVVQSTFLHEAPHPRADYFTTGVHPLDAETAAAILSSGVECLRANLIDKRNNTSTPLLALGELGWDKRAQLSTDEQTTLVRWQLDLAEELGLPVVFHMVGHWDLLMAEYRARDPQEQWWVHGFRGKPMLLLQLQRAGISVSLSKCFSWKCAPAPGTFLLETDEATGTLTESYSRAAASLKISTEDLSYQLLNTFQRLLPR